MKIEILMATMYQTNKLFVNNKNITSSIIIVNQTNVNETENLENTRDNIKMINVNERGLSKSRNLALKTSNSDICILADDDEVFLTDYVEKIKEAYTEYIDADIIAFKVLDTQETINAKKYSTSSKKINYISAMKLRSVEITFKRKAIIDKGITFNENFGAGSGKYFSGEETIFLYECLKKGLKIRYVPVPIAYLEPSESSWFNGFSDKYFFDKGACFGAMSKWFSILLILQFCIRKYFLYKHQISLLNAIKNSLYGRKSYLLTK